MAKNKSKRFDDLMAVKTIVRTLQELDSEMRTRVLRWAREKLDEIDKSAAKLERKAAAKAKKGKGKAAKKKKKGGKKKAAKKKTTKKKKAAKKKTTKKKTTARKPAARTGKKR